MSLSNEITTFAQCNFSSNPTGLPRLVDFRNWLMTSEEVETLKILLKTALPAHLALLSGSH